MTQQIINAGTEANDGLGDSLRSGASKINDNFTELYSQVGLLELRPAIPGQSGNSGKFLTTVNGVLSWATVSSVSGSSSYTYTLPTATTTALGGVKVDGTTVAITNQVISVGSIPYNKISNPPSIPTLVSQLTNNVGFLTTVAWTVVTGKPTFATVATSGSYTDLTNTPASYTLPAASTTITGGIKIDGVTLALNGSGQLYYTGGGAGGYTLPTAGTGAGGTLGGVKVDGTSITINSGIISAAGGSSYTLPASNTTALGGVIIPLVATSGITNTSGTIGLAVASSSQLGGVKVDGTSITSNVSGVISVSNGVYTTDTGTVTNAMLAGSIVNTKLVNSTISGKALGTNLDALTIGTGLSGTSYNGSSAITISLASSYGDTQNPFASKTAKYFLASPSGASGVPTFRVIDASDIPTLNQNTSGTASNVSGVVATANGGTGLSTTPANGSLDIGNGTGFTRTTLTPGTGIDIVNSAGAITISSTATSSLPSQTGNENKYLFTNGSVASWRDITFPPGMATGVSVSLDAATSVIVSFTAGTNGTQNRIYYSTTSPVTTSSSYIIAAGTGSGTVTGLPANTLYYFAVGTYNTNSTVLSLEVSITTASGVTYTAGQSFDVSSGTSNFVAGGGVTSMKIEISGGGGGGGGGWNHVGAPGGAGGIAAGIYNLSASRSFTYYVGSGGSAGAGYASPGHGGGASAVVIHNTFTAIVVAGGGGGGGDGWNGTAGTGGAGGTAVSQAGAYVGNGANGATTQSAGGGGGTSSAGTNASNSLANASGRTGGKGGKLGGSGGGGSSGYGEGGSFSTDYYWAGGGGGGGYTGGAGGWGASAGDGGGGGSSYLATGISSTTASFSGALGGNGAASGNGQYNAGTAGGQGRIKVTFI